MASSWKSRRVARSLDLQVRGRCWSSLSAAGRVCSLRGENAGIASVPQRQERAKWETIYAVVRLLVGMMSIGVIY
jgi:hypothetical protein